MKIILSFIFLFILFCNAQTAWAQYDNVKKRKPKLRELTQISLGDSQELIQLKQRIRRRRIAGRVMGYGSLTALVGGATIIAVGTNQPWYSELNYFVGGLLTMISGVGLGFVAIIPTAMAHMGTQQLLLLDISIKGGGANSIGGLGLTLTF